MSVSILWKHTATVTHTDTNAGEWQASCFQRLVPREQKAMWVSELHASLFYFSEEKTLSLLPRIEHRISNYLVKLLYRVKYPNYQ